MLKNGYMAIVTVLVLLAVTGGIALSLTLLSIDAAQSGEALQRGEQALLFSESCLEEGLLQISRDPEYTGQNFTMPQGDCEVAVGKNDEIYTIHAVGKNTQFEKGIVAEATLEIEKMQVISWNEE